MRAGCLRIGDFEIEWLEGGRFSLDAGTMFGPVPKALWARRWAADDDNCITLLNAPLLLRGPGVAALLDTGLGNKLTDKQKRIFRVRTEWDLPGELARRDLGREDITHVVLTHCDFDHAGGVVMAAGDGGTELTFPRARHVVQSAEWEDVLAPTERSGSSYWADNFTGLAESGRLELLDGARELAPGITVFPTGGHTRGHQGVEVRSRGQVAVHLADLLPTHVHWNPLWVTAYDNYPLEAIERKRELEGRYAAERAWFTFYHDPFCLACRFDPEGNILDRIEA